MASKVIQYRGGTTTEHATFVGADREVTVDTTKKTLVVHDGATVGGTPLAKASDITTINTTLASKQPIDADLTAIADLAGTSGILKKTAANAWALDTNTYVTSSGVTAISGTAPIVSSGGNTPAISITAATTSAAGSMSAADKTKLDGLSNYSKPVAEPISYITGLQTALDGKATTTALNTEKGRIDAILLSAGASTDTFAEIVTLINSVDTTNDTAFAGYVTSNNNRSTTIETNVTNLTNNKANKATTLADYGITDAAASTHIHTNATTSVAGFMSNTDKSKLDGIATGANNYVKPVNEPISYITGLQTALDGKANLTSPNLTGTPTAPTAAAGTNNTQLATTEFVVITIGNQSISTAAPTGGANNDTWYQY